ncbi:MULTISPECIES: hypothetical protein [Micromonospora]|uniref:hypothetical protein n=1 Tax=Micromonospora TaxID=1873 RepID=UPI00098D695E|nr:MULTISPECIES: hypothetical protein [unclassified Micromonospora]
MTEPTTLGRYHELLLRLAGRVSDVVVTGARQRLSEGRVEDVARALRAAVGSGRLTVDAAEAALLAAALPDVDDPAPRNAGRAAALPAYAFAPLLPGDSATMVPVVLDLTSTVAADGGPDAAAVAVAAAAPGAVGLWRAWRAPNATNPGRPAPVYLLETTADPEGQPGIAAAVQGALWSAGVEHPQVEVYGPATALPPYQRLARGRSALLWAARPAGPVTIARVFDRVDPVAGPRFDPGHEVLPAGPERDRVLSYLRAGHVLMATTAGAPDVVEPRRGDVVPMSYRTDGAWIWTDTVAYYLECHGLSPDVELMAHLRSAGDRPVVDSVAAHRAMVALTAPVEQPPAWTVAAAPAR